MAAKRDESARSQPSEGLSDGYLSGFCAITGRTNVGKSTLVNRCVGQKIAIVSEKPQTTRNRITGVYHGDDCQIVFLDTPGFQRPRDKLEDHLVDVAEGSWEEVEAICFMVEATSPQVGGGDKFIADKLEGVDSPVILVLNKIDAVARGELTEIQNRYREQLGPFDDFIAISALHGTNVAEFLNLVKKRLPEGPPYFPTHMTTDRSELFLVSELIREKILRATRQEVPHSTAVVIDEAEERDNGILYIRATIFCERESQKGILIGRKGKMLKRMGTEARVEIEKLLGTDIYLDLWVKVRKNWRDREAEIMRLGYGEQRD